MTDLQLDPQLDKLSGRDRRPYATASAASPMPEIFFNLFSVLSLNAGTMSGRICRLPGRNCRGVAAVGRPATIRE